MRNLIKTLLMQWRIRRAEYLARLTGYKYYVIYIRGRFKVISKVEAKRLIKTKFFIKGTTIEQIEKKAVYTTKTVNKNS